MREIIESELRGASVIKDSEKLKFDYVPERLPHREEEMGQLARSFRSLITSNAPQSALITGPVGSGKTALAKRFAEEFKKLASERGVLVEWTDVNCRRRATESASLLKIVSHFSPNFPDRGFSTTEMLDILKKNLTKRGARLIIILDEAEILLRKSGPDIIYRLTRFTEDEPGANFSVSLILVSQENPRLLMDEASRSTFKASNTITLTRYTAQQLATIVMQRAELAFHKGTIDEDCVELVADIAAEDGGNARMAIEILGKAGELADTEGQRTVSPEHVRAAKADTYSFVTESKLLELDPHKRLVLLGISRSLLSGQAFARTSEAESRYALACEEFGDRARAHTQFWTYIKELEGEGLISAKRSGKGITGATTLISLPDIPAKALEEKLLAIIREESGMGR
ncbi:MAG: AAA family ATPase [Euryarchaeota archaeon]|nr:AAA family ATPase [Euryarchaeota archaeon]